MLEHVSFRIIVILQLFAHTLDPHWLLNDRIVVGSLLLGHRLTEWPGILMIIERLQNVVTLLFERLLLSFLHGFVVCLRPASLNEAWYVAELVVEAATLADVETAEDAARD